MGQNRAPLRYVICKKPDPSYNGEDDEAYDFEQLYINCAPLYLLLYKTDARKVNHMIYGFV